MKNQIFKNLNTHKHYLIVLGLLSMFFFGVFLGKSNERSNVKKYAASFENLRDKDKDFSYISPLLGVTSAPATDIGLYRNIKEDIIDYLESEKKKGNLYDMSFYFKDLTSPLWFGIDEDKSFAPASLFKLPIAIIAFRQGEMEPGFLDRELLYTQEMYDANNSIPGNEVTKLEVGKMYQIEYLIKMMLEYSDNGAKDLLSSAIDQKYISELFKITDLLDPSNANTYQISSRKYALFLRLLYNGSYLKSKHSEYILSVLAKSTFDEGLVAELPRNTIIAHKFGVHGAEIVLDGKTVQSSVLHDCGIVYYLDAPYAICVMTQGKDVQTLANIIATISKMMYEDVKLER